MIISSPNDDDCVIINSDEVEGNLEIANIDHVSEKVLGISEYTQDIYKYLKEAEVCNFVKLLLQILFLLMQKSEILF